MKILADYWFSTMRGLIGIVIGEDEFTKEHKGYIGMVDGHNQQADMEYILDYGSPLSIPILKAILQTLIPERKENNGNKDNEGI